MVSVLPVVLVLSGAGALSQEEVMLDGLPYIFPFIFVPEGTVQSAKADGAAKRVRSARVVKFNRKRWEGSGGKNSGLLALLQQITGFLSCQAFSPRFLPFFPLPKIPVSTGLIVPKSSPTRAAFVKGVHRFGIRGRKAGLIPDP
ncbi:MAG: hypothetical protein LBI62_07440 [Candidatus Accumulibacter sp.]|jgi:hypothetical protein|nr:hypothetical protein [Accumulibacter sp.]